jgi:phenylpropionate dioxygenase-like ring-hydroxylating dioxygenase large terminal subunit
MPAPTMGDQGRMTAAGPRSAGPLYQEILDRDSRPVPPLLRVQSPIAPGVKRVPADRYTSRAIHDLEVETIWKRVWQAACREEEIPDVGDYIIYDIAHLSFLVVRTGPDKFKAFRNACPHRGRQLREYNGKRATEFRCFFHGWAWEIDGRLKDVTCPWDFPDVGPENYSMREVKTGTWGGFVFINPDPNAEPLADFLGDLPRHFERWPYEKRYKQVHVAKILRCNWKVAQEAFMEAYHAVVTHPQGLQSLGDSNSQYDVFGNFSRAITPTAVGSPHLKNKPAEQEIVNSMLGVQEGEPPPVQLPEGMTARAFMAQQRREALRPIWGDMIDEYCDAEMLDAKYFTLFPNLHPWGGFSSITYRFRPYGDDPDMSIMEVMFLTLLPEGMPRPKPAPIHWLGPDDDWVEAPELGGLARVFQQDSFNLPKVQLGLKVLDPPEVQFASYNETKIKHFHDLWEKWTAAK